MRSNKPVPVRFAAPGPAHREKPAATAPASRVASVDALRGLVMIIMALDHVRGFHIRREFRVACTDPEIHAILALTVRERFLAVWSKDFLGRQI